MLITAGCIAATKLNPKVNQVMMHLQAPAIGTLLIAFIIEIAIICSKTLARKVPYNYVLLLLFTLCEAFTFSVICSMYSVNATLYAAITTSTLTVALTIYAYFAKIDLTIWWGLFISIAVASIMLFVM